MGKKYVPPEEMEFLMEVIPPHLHKWLDYVSDPEPPDALTPNEERNGVDAYGRPINQKKDPALKPLGSSGEKGPQVVLQPKPRKSPPKAEIKPDATVDVQKTLLEMALSDEDDD